MTYIDNSYIVEKCLTGVLFKMTLSDDQLYSLIVQAHPNCAIDRRFLFYLESIERDLMDFKYPDGRLNPAILDLIIAKCKKIIGAV